MCALELNKNETDITLIECNFILKPEVEADFTLPLSDTTAQAHESATFTCEVTKDDADVQWLHKNEEVKPSDKFKVEKDGRKHSLTVLDLEPEDSGEFTARVGGKDTSANLTVSGRFAYYK